MESFDIIKVINIRHIYLDLSKRRKRRKNNEEAACPGAVCRHGACQQKNDTKGKANDYYETVSHPYCLSWQCMIAMRTVSYHTKIHSKNKGEGRIYQPYPPAFLGVPSSFEHGWCEPRAPRMRQNAITDWAQGTVPCAIRHAKINGWTREKYSSCKRHFLPWRSWRTDYWLQRRKRLFWCRRSLMPDSVYLRAPLLSLLHYHTDTG